ncbi:MAG: D-glycero-beta-D-manno-heptose 1-phosphate adenylyltransferase [Saprospiraceae bacterium]|nr:D-glycero-beta-D-manno-heptose 1-phosphate adenylyltransferase [Saprospiraceae bacterium]MBK8450298.1 D-glycero-beta-D-manno-heptose 1-phosphate adenylyltransferase [Saprospiraceae bacterium]MBK8485612.1 D-glycero-beta-D-manno-heptose 1-phosphate adenylyltransferase [Saprospiraceae bacterium]MBK9222841.1 D-glycero-beta-D-manno-heptose 1-phosphate adenylyltransferase [Saprospiraceae bacterium]MBK9720118.1 D-glycero-beta-D-manno-heptose 1-phosphate adenylyltransferase [Saprospiraceae bacterium
MKYSLESKIYTQESLQEKCKEWKNDQNVLVFTNGCFDILHEGHVRYLSEAKTLGNKLIVALNADASVRKLKGAGRPINLQNSRAIVLAGLESVDAIVVFYEETPFELISKILPNVLVKGGDWKVEQIIGSDVVLNTGGKVYSLTFHAGYSTSLVEQKIKNKS